MRGKRKKRKYTYKELNQMYIERIESESLRPETEEQKEGVKKLLKEVNEGFVRHLKAKGELYLIEGMKYYEPYKYIIEEEE